MLVVTARRVHIPSYLIDFQRFSKIPTSFIANLILRKIQPCECLWIVNIRINDQTRIFVPLDWSSKHQRGTEHLCNQWHSRKVQIFSVSINRKNDTLVTDMKSLVSLDWFPMPRQDSGSLSDSFCSSAYPVLSGARTDWEREWVNQWKHDVVLTWLVFSSSANCFTFHSPISSRLRSNLVIV